MLIDKLLYLIIPARAHVWAAENKAKVRAYVLAVIAPAAVMLAEQYVSEEWRAWAISALASAGAVVTGNSIHKNVSAWDGYDD